MVPGNPLVYTAVITLVPEIKIGDWHKIKIEKKEVKVDPAEVDRVLENLRQLHAKETIKLGKLEKGDKAVVSFEVFVDQVAIEGGSHPEYPLVIGEGRFIPGFEEQLIGLTKTDKKEFELHFPADYHQKNIAGKLAKFKIEIKETYRRELPELNDDFAKTLGDYPSLEEIRKGIEENLRQEAEHKEGQRQEIALLEEMIKLATFGDIPENLIQSEAHRMVHELENSIEHQGLKFEDYLTHLKKTEADLEKEFLDEAKKRLQTALITRQIAKEKNLSATPEEIDQELESAKKYYEDNAEALENLQSRGYRQYLANTLTNRKVIDFLKKELVK
jgi:trigger factor